MASDWIKGVIRRPVRLAGTIGWTGAMTAAVNLRRAVVKGERKDIVLDRYMRVWTRGLLRMFGVRVTAIPGPPAPARGARLVISNHRAVTDIPVLLTYFGGSVLSRADLARWPILGDAAKTARTIFVERDQKTSRSNAVKVIRERLIEGGTVTVFPEGTVHPGDELLTFRRGAFAAASGLDVEIVPVGIAYPPEAEWVEEGFLEHLSNVASRPAFDCVMNIGQAIQATGEPDQLATQTQRAVQDLVHGARRVLPG